MSMLDDKRRLFDLNRYTTYCHITVSRSNTSCTGSIIYFSLLLLFFFTPYLFSALEISCQNFPQLLLWLYRSAGVGCIVSLVENTESNAVDTAPHVMTLIAWDTRADYRCKASLVLLI